MTTPPDFPNLPISDKVGFAALFTVLLLFLMRLYWQQQQEVREDRKNTAVVIQENTRAMTNMDSTMREMMRMFEKFEQRLNHIESKTG